MVKAHGYLNHVKRHGNKIYPIRCPVVLINDQQEKYGFCHAPNILMYEQLLN